MANSTFSFQAPVSLSTTAGDSPSCSSPITHGAIRGRHLLLFSDDTCSSAAVTLDLDRYASIAAGPEQWDMLLSLKPNTAKRPPIQRPSETAKHGQAVSHRSVPAAQGVSSRGASSWFRAKLRTTSISSNNAAAQLLSSSTSSSSSSSPSVLEAGPVTLSTTSRELQGKWMEAIDAILYNKPAEPPLLLAHSSSLPSELSEYRLPRKALQLVPSPLRSDEWSDPFEKEEEEDIPEESRPTSPNNTGLRPHRTPRPVIMRTGSAPPLGVLPPAPPMNPLLPHWLDQQKRCNTAPPLRTTRSSSSLQPGARQPTIAVHLDDSSRESELLSPSDEMGRPTRKLWPRKASQAHSSSLGASARGTSSHLRPSPSTSSLASTSSAWCESMVSSAPSSAPQTPNVTFSTSPLDSPPTELGGKGKGFFAFRDRAAIPVQQGQAGERPIQGRSGISSVLSSVFSGGRSSTESAASSVPSSKTAETETSVTSAEDETEKVGGYIIDPKELRRHMEERMRARTIGADMKRPSTSPAIVVNSDSSLSSSVPISPELASYTFGRAHPAQVPSSSFYASLVAEAEQPKPKPPSTKMDMEALFAALPPPRKRAHGGAHLGMKLSSSSSSIAALSRPIPISNAPRTSSYSYSTSPVSPLSADASKIAKSTAASGSREGSSMVNCRRHSLAPGLGAVDDFGRRESNATIKACGP